MENVTMAIRRLLLMSSAVLALAAVRAEGSCNTIPAPPVVFAGVRGSVDRPFLSPDRDQRVTVRYDLPADGVAAQALARGDLLVTISCSSRRDKPRTNLRRRPATRFSSRATARRAGSLQSRRAALAAIVIATA
jgi:hypothetical protein